MLWQNIIGVLRNVSLNHAYMHCHDYISTQRDAWLPDGRVMSFLDLSAVYYFYVVARSCVLRPLSRLSHPTFSLISITSLCKFENTYFNFKRAGEISVDTLEFFRRFQVFEYCMKRDDCASTNSYQRTFLVVLLYQCTMTLSCVILAGKWSLCYGLWRCCTMNVGYV